MSSILFATTPSQVFFAQDTLGYREGGERFTFGSKTLYLPHLRLIIASTGKHGFAELWYQQINSGFLVRDIDDLDKIAPMMLSALWKSFETLNGVDEDSRQTIYHFGLSSETGEVKIHVYQSGDDWKSHSWPAGSSGGNPPYSSENFKTVPDDFVKIMYEQRDAMARLPPEKRVEIGGEIQVFELNSNGVFASYCIHRFPDYDEDWRQMNDNRMRDMMAAVALNQIRMGAV